MDPEAIVTAFNDAITHRDLAALGGLMSDDHVFTDSAGQRIAGKAAVLDAWAAFFAMFPGYENHFRTMRPNSDTVVIVGDSRADDPRLDGPALWRAHLRDGVLTGWEVFEDTPATRSLLGLSTG